MNKQILKKLIILLYLCLNIIIYSFFRNLLHLDYDYIILTIYIWYLGVSPLLFLIIVFSPSLRVLPSNIFRFKTINTIFSIFYYVINIYLNFIVLCWLYWMLFGTV